jgi:hypothetical protein
MRNCARLIVVAGLLALLPSLETGFMAQEPPAEEPPATPAAEDLPAGDEEETRTETKSRLGLFLSVGGGTSSVDDINSSVITRPEVDEASSAFTLDDQLYARAAIGWKLKEDKGDFRLMYQGFREDTYRLQSEGKSANVLDGNFATTPVTWWNMSIDSGQLSAQRTPRWWTVDYDLPGPGGEPPNDRPDPNEIQSTDCADPSSPFQSQCRSVTKIVPETLNNQVQTFDLVYGREFGRRRVSSRWWGGLRYFEYTGQIAAPAWLMSGQFAAGVGYTDSTFLKMLLLSQESKGLGPTGAWELDVNFFDRRLVLYLRGQASFIFSTIEVDSGPFVTMVKNTSLDTILLVNGRLNESREKSVWQTALEIGARYTFFQALTVEVAFFRAGFLDSIILPAQIIVPEKEQTLSDGVSALYGTQDYKVGGMYAGLAFQF